jgi:hypothetical protein
MTQLVRMNAKRAERADNPNRSERRLGCGPCPTITSTSMSTIRGRKHEIGYLANGRDGEVSTWGA